MEITDDFAARYGAMADAELLGAAESYDTLIDGAQAAMRAEFARRGMEAPLAPEPEAEFVSRTLVVVRRYRDLSAATVGRSLLESNGIDSWQVGAC
jgi:hypothetical protein